MANGFSLIFQYIFDVCFILAKYLSAEFIRKIYIGNDTWERIILKGSCGLDTYFTWIDFSIFHICLVHHLSSSRKSYLSESQYFKMYFSQMH